MAFTVTLIVGGGAIVAVSVGAWYWQPSLVELVCFLLAEHAIVTGIWLGLTVIGVDFGMVAGRDAIGYRQVGSKSLAHWRLTGGGK